MFKMRVVLCGLQSVQQQNHAFRIYEKHDFDAEHSEIHTHDNRMLIPAMRFNTIFTCSGVG